MLIDDGIMIYAEFKICERILDIGKWLAVTNSQNDKLRDNIEHWG